MALNAPVIVFGAFAIVLVLLASFYVGGRFGREEHAPSAEPSVPDPVGMWSAHVGSLQEPVRPPDEPELTARQRQSAASTGSDPGIYRARATSPFGSDHWDPFAESQSRANRAKAARRKPRPPRAGSPGHGMGDTPDVYDLLGISPLASSAEIEHAYRRQVAAIHPDKFFDDPVRRRHAHQRLTQLNLAMQTVREHRRNAPPPQ